MNFLLAPKLYLIQPLLYLQAAVYGIGVCAEFGGSVFKPLVQGWLHLDLHFGVVEFPLF